MTFKEADSLCTRICNFLHSFGGVYENITPNVEKSILQALASGNYVMKEDERGILYFASYWRVHPEDVEKIKHRQTPTDIRRGSVVYVSEAGNRMGKPGMAEIVRRLREQAVGMKGLFWHRPAKGDKVYHFPSQKGASHG